MLGGVDNVQCCPFSSSVIKNEANALEYWKLAACPPHKNPEAMFRLGLAAFFGVVPSPSTGFFSWIHLFLFYKNIVDSL